MPALVWRSLRTVVAAGLLVFGLASSLRSDTYHLISPTAAGVSSNPGQSLSVASTANSGFSPTRSLTATPAYWYSPAISGSFTGGTWQLVVWSSSPGCISNVTGEIGYSNPDGTGFVSLGIQTLDFNQPGNHPNAFSFTVPFQNLVSKVLRVSLTLSSGCSSTMAYNAGVDFDSRLITPAFGPNGTPTVSPTFSPSPTNSPTPVPPLIKSVNTASAFVGQTLTYTLNYKNPNPASPAGCADNFETGSTAWPNGWNPPSGGIWGLSADNGPSAGGSQALDAQTTGGFQYTTIGCAQDVTDGQLQVDAKIFTATGEISLLWRQGGSSTYQFHLVQGTTANASLRVITNGAFNEIAVASTPIALGQWYTLKLVVTGFTLSAYVNGALLISATDPNTTYSAGAAGLEIDDAPATGMHARFDNVQITKYQLDWYGVSMIDTLPAGVTFLSSSCGGSVSGQTVTLPLGTLTAGTVGTCSILAVVNACPGTLANQADFHVSLPAMSFTSNSVTTTVSCATKTPTPTASPSATPSTTPTATPSATPSATRTASPSATPSPTPSATRSASPTASPSPSPSSTSTLSPSPTVTATRTPTATPSDTSTATPSATDGPTATPSDTATVTATATPSPTGTDTFTATSTRSATPTLTATGTWTPTNSVTPSATALSTQSQTSSPTATGTSSGTPTCTATPSVTPSRTASPSASPSATASASPSPTPSLTATPSATPSFTASPTVSPSPTRSPSPIPLPYSLHLGVYNAAGERVRELFQGPVAALPNGVRLGANTLIPGLGSVGLIDAGGPLSGLPGWDGSNDQGRPLSSGVYYFKVEARDAFGLTTSTVLPVQLLSAPNSQVLALDVFNSAGERVASLPLSPPAAAGGVRLLNAVVVPGESPLQVQTTDSSGAVRTLNWDGLNATGTALASGSYTLRAAGQGPGLADLQLPFAVLAGPGAVPTAPHIAPNPVPAAATTLVVLAPGGGGPWRVELYDLAGGLLRSGAAAPGAAVLLPLGPISGGVYLAVVHSRDAQGREHHWTLKAAVLR